MDFKILRTKKGENKMKLNMKKNYSKQNGITLIALVVTIVVLLILAGVSVNALFGNSGIIEKAKEAQNAMNMAKENDEKGINELTNWLENQVNGTTGGSITGGVKLETPNLVTASNATGSSPAKWEEVKGAAYYEVIVSGSTIKDRDGALKAAFRTGTFYWDDTLSETYGYSKDAKMQLLKFNATEISYSDVSSIGDNICVRAIPQNTNDYASEWSDWYYMYLCLSGDTEIIVYDEEKKKKKKKKLKDIKVGEKVVTFNPTTKEWEINEVIDCDFDNVKTMLEYDIWTFSDGTEITTVNRHRFYNVEYEKMMYMDEWQIGDRIYKVDGTMPRLVKHEHVIGPIRHYTLVTKNENYIANDCITGTRNMKPIKLNELKPLKI